MEGKVGAGDFEDMADGMQCSDHPYRNNLGGICAFCLQDKLGKLVSSSSFPFAVAVASSSPSSPRSFRSDVASSTNAAAAAAAVNSTALYSSKSSKLDLEIRNKSRMISFLLAKKNRNKKPSSSEASLKRSKSTAAARHGTRAALEQFGSRNHRNYLQGSNDADGGNMSPRRRGSFWSFLSSKSSATRKQGGDPKSSNAAEDTLSAFPEDDDDDVSPVNSQSTAADSISLPGAFDRKVSRSRSVGCGSRSFSGDFFERISTGLGDCALRRVESQREGRPKNHHHHHHHHLQQPSSAIAAAHQHRCMKERVKCAGIIFGGFSSSSSSSSSYWASSSGEDKPAGAHLRHQKSWNWAFASPMRAFTRPPSTKYSKREMVIREASNKSSVPNLAAIPSILSVVGG